MVKDIYAIYESYLTQESVGAASITNSEGGFGGARQSFRPISQGSTAGDRGENEESTAIVNLTQALLNAAKAGAYDKMIFDCKKLSELLAKVYNRK